MPRKIIKLYLASVSHEMDEERHLLPDILRQINESKAHAMGLFIETVGQVEGAPGEPATLERVAATIKDCDLFVMLLWKRLDEHSGGIFNPRAPGVFNIADAEYKEHRRPQIFLYFRAVLPSMMADPGWQLERVINFRDRIEKERAYLSSIYDSLDQWKELMLLHLGQWVDDYANGTSYLSEGIHKRLIILPLTGMLSRRLRAGLEEVMADSRPTRELRIEALRHALYALELSQQGQITLAERSFAQSLELYEDPEVLYCYGLFLDQLELLDRAESVFQRLLQHPFSQSDSGRLYQSYAVLHLGRIYATRAAKAIMPDAVKEQYERFIAEWLGLKDVPTGSIDFRDYFLRLARVTPRSTMAHGLAAAFRSKDTDPFGQMVSNLYTHSRPEPQFRTLSTLISSLGGQSRISTLARYNPIFGELDRLIKDRILINRYPPDISPDLVGEVATQAELQNPFTVEKVSRVYSAYPETVKHLGAVPLTVALSSMFERESKRPEGSPLLGRVLRGLPGSDLPLERTSVTDFFMQASARPVVTASNKIWSIKNMFKQRSPRKLFANSHFEDELTNTFSPQLPLVAGRSYRFVFSISGDPSEIAFGSEPFTEILELERAEKSRVDLEIVCPLLDMKSRRGVMRRAVTYYSGKGIRPQPFPIKPAEVGNYSLTVRLFYIRRLLYRVMFPIQVIADSGKMDLARVPGGHVLSPSQSS